MEKSQDRVSYLLYIDIFSILLKELLLLLLLLLLLRSTSFEISSQETSIRFFIGNCLISLVKLGILFPLPRGFKTLS